LKKYLLFFFYIYFVQFGYSQSDFIEPDYIKTIIFKPTATNNYAPIIRLGEKLVLTFDDLNADEHNYTYKIEHCTLDWEISNLSEFEFINGYAEDRIRNKW